MSTNDDFVAKSDVNNSNAAAADAPEAETVKHPVWTSHDVHGVAEKIKQCNRIVICCGAGISVAAGISDFRSPGGLYSQLAKYNLPRPEALFTIDYFKKDPAMFYKVASEMKLWPGALAPTKVHYFISLLAKKGKLLTAFTQNIDTLELLAGVPPERLVEAHGSFARSSCIGKAKHPMPTPMVKAIADKGEVPVCTICDTPVKPDVVFFGEALPTRFFVTAENSLPQCDLLITIGTSLEVYPFAAIASKPENDEYPRVLINMNRVGDFTCIFDKNAPADPSDIQDVFLGGDCQSVIEELCDALGWRSELMQMYNEGQATFAKAKADGRLILPDGMALDAAPAAAAAHPVDKVADEVEKNL